MINEIMIVNYSGKSNNDKREEEKWVVVMVLICNSYIVELSLMLLIWIGNW